MQDRKNILVFIEHFYSAHKSGGPLLSISNLLKLTHSKTEFKVLTQTFTTNSNNCNVWHETNGFNVFSCTSVRDLIKGIKSSECSIYYLNSFFNYKYSILILVLLKLGIIPEAKILLAPRGELSEGALTIKKFKKKAFIFFSRLTTLHYRITWHASTELEAKEIKKIIEKDVKIKIALDLPDRELKPSAAIKPYKNENLLKIVFISRIDRKKNLHFVFEVLSRVKGNYILDIYGPINDNKYWHECNRAIKKVNATYKGVVENNKINEIYPKYDIFFFPTLGENFGHVIYESLALGVPVLCSDKTPWNELESYNAGWNIKLEEKNKYINTIEYLIPIGEESFKKYREGAFNYAQAVLNNKQHLPDNLSLFIDL